jgi:hypothetical protein
MKTLIYTTFITLSVLFFPNLMWAQNHDDEKQQAKLENITNTKVIQKGSNFVDENKNGVCDNYENRSPGQRGVNFVDADKDGICDNRKNKSVRNGNGNRYGQGCGKRNGMYRGNCRGKGQGIR